MQEVSREVECSSIKFSFQSLSNWQAMQSCWKSSPGTKTITSSFSSFRSHLFITLYFIPPQSYTVTNPLHHHNKMLLFLALLQKNQAEALVKKAVLLLYTRLLPSSLKKQKHQTGENWQSQRKVLKQCEKQNICAKKSQSSLLSAASLYIQLITPSPHSSAEQAQQIAHYKVSCKHSVLCTFDSSFITPE